MEDEHGRRMTMLSTGMDQVSKAMFDLKHFFSRHDIRVTVTAEHGLECRDILYQQAVKIPVPHEPCGKKNFIVGEDLPGAAEESGACFIEKLLYRG